MRVKIDSENLLSYHECKDILTFEDSFLKAILLLFFMDTSTALTTTRVGISHYR